MRILSSDKCFHVLLRQQSRIWNSIQEPQVVLQQYLHTLTIDKCHKSKVTLYEILLEGGTRKFRLKYVNVFPKQKQSNTIKMQEALSLKHAKNQPKSLPLKVGQ